LAFAFHFLIYIVVWADTATNTQAAQSPTRCRQAFKLSNNLSVMVPSLTKFVVLSTLIFLVCTQCQSTKRSRFLRKEYKSIYINQFKLTYIRKMLIKSYNNTPAIQEIIRTDHSGFTEPILTEDDYKLIDSLTTVDNQQMVIDSANGKYRAEGSKGKRPFGRIIKKLESKWLDSIANKRYKISGLKKERHH